MNKRGDMTIQELIVIIIVIVFLVVAIGGVVLFKVKGGSILDAIKSMFSFGR